MDNHHSKASHLTSTSSRPLKIALTIVLVVMVFEVIGGILSNSLALHCNSNVRAARLDLFAI